MSNRNNFYNLNSTRAWPLDDAATGTDDVGAKLPQDILVDCHLQFPESAGKYAYLGGVTVTARLVTVTFLASETPDAASGFVPLGAVTLQKPVLPHVHYPIEALFPGVGGFIVFENTEAAFVGRFSGPEQSRLLMRCARAYSPLPITSLRKRGHVVGLTGLINLVAGSDLELVKESLTIDGAQRDALVIRLGQAPNRNVLQDYIGPCGTRPESRTCRREGIESINEALPDCDGNIDIEFVGLTPGPYVDCGPGITMDHSFGLDYVCAATDVADFIGTDLCASESSESEAPIPSNSLSQSSLSVSSESVACAELPYCENFDDQQAEFFVIKSGSFVFEADDSPEESCAGISSVSSEIISSVSSSSSCYWASSSSSDSMELVWHCDPTIVPYTVVVLVPYIDNPDWSYVARSASQKNISVWDACAYSNSVDKKVTVDLQLRSNQTSQRNGGIVINYHTVDPLTNPHIEYFIALLDQLRNKLRLLHSTGSGSWITVNEATLGSPAILGHWYRMEVTTSQLSPTQTVITVRVSGISNPAWPAVQFSVATTQYLPADGMFGVGSDHAYTRFSFFSVVEV